MMQRLSLFAALLCLTASPLRAGDAIALGYNYDGVWTAVTYNRSSTPPSGPHYHDAAQACLLAERDLRLRANEELARITIIGQSDRTGYVTVARGSIAEANKIFTAIGRGESQKEADENALKQLTAKSITSAPTIVYQYFSYGRDLHSAVKHNHPKRT